MYKGLFYLLASSIFFSLSTVFAKFVTNGTEVIAIEITFFRFLFGFIFASIMMIVTGNSLKPNNIKYVTLRAVLNVIAVILFFLGIEHSTVTNANMLNMTYPLFVFILSPMINREHLNKNLTLYLLTAMAGVYFVIGSDFNQVNMGDLYSLLSAVIAGIAICFLREARKFDKATVIMFYLMGFGLILNFVIMYKHWVMPGFKYLMLIFLSAITAVLGQFTITVGYKFIDASKGAIVSISRILWASCLGIYFFDDVLTLIMVIGAILIIFSLLGVSGIFKNFKYKYNKS